LFPEESACVSNVQIVLDQGNRSPHTKQAVLAPEAKVTSQNFLLDPVIMDEVAHSVAFYPDTLTQFDERGLSWYDDGDGVGS
jgi:hypothetical protein